MAPRHSLRTAIDADELLRTLRRLVSSEQAGPHALPRCPLTFGL